MFSGGYEGHLLQISVVSEYYDLVKVAENIIKHYFKKIYEETIYEILSIGLQYNDYNFKFVANIIVNNRSDYPLLLNNHNG